ncbi:MAG: UvrD-helicase domain-containing protein [Elusimicrobiota bacterium]
MGNKFPVKDDELIFPDVVILSSSAGSGKTYNLVSRYVQFLLSKRINNNDISNILAITFTENATKEMRQEIISLIKRIVKDKNKRDDFIKNLLGIDVNYEKMIVEKADRLLNKIFDNYYNFYVETIDSFIVKILSVSLNELRIPYDFEIVFDTEKGIKKSLTDYLERGDESDRKYIDDFLENINAVETNYVYDPFKKLVEMFSEINDKENKYLAKVVCSSKISLQDFKKLEEEIIRQSKALCDYNIGEFKNSFKLLENNDIKFIDGINEEAFLYNKNKGFDKKFNALPKETQNSFKDELKTLVLNVCDYYYHKAFIKYSKYSEFYLKFKEFYDNHYKKQKKIVLSRITAELSREIKNLSVPEIYFKLSSHLKHFLIDEFQDTSLSQWEILRPLIEESIATGGSCFLIGDVKQAIYMFRNADYKIMKSFLDDNKSVYLNTDSLRNGIEHFNLEKNYRSKKKIVEYVNKFFESIASSNPFGENLEGLKDYIEIFNKGQKSADNNDEGYVKSIMVEDREKLKEEFLNIIKDVSQRFNLDSIAVLVPRNDDVEEVVKWLYEIGINSASFSSLDIRKRKTINEILSFLKFINNHDNFNFSVFLLGDIVKKTIEKDFKKRIDFSDFIYKNKEKEFIYVDFRKEYPEIWNKYFDEIFAKSGYLSVYELLNLFFSKFLVYENFPQESAFFIKFFDIVNQLTLNENVCDITSLCKYFDDEKNSDYFAVNIPTDVVAVKVMTFHKAKGLGFDVVINIFENNHFNVRIPNIKYFIEGENIHILAINKDWLRFTVDNEKIKKLKDIYFNIEKEEYIAKLNVLYVALTRAKKELYNIVLPKKEPKNGNKKENDWLRNIFDKDFLGEYGKKYDQVKTDAEVSLSEFSHSKHLSAYNFIRDEKESYESLIGKIYHMVMSMIEYIPDDKLTDYIKKSADFYGLSINDIKLEEIKKDIYSAIEKMRDLFVYKTNRKIKNEFEFIYNSSIFRVDRLVIDDDCVYIVDYKTGLEKDYSRQMDIYKKIVSGYYKGKQVKCYIYYFDTKKIIEY